ncbi:hypothetical protein PEC311524_43950 [Pectobacterium carotovorum subsp. carotovorum]|nr:hypothetical protein PEC311524_43950 [Pectobacterium carotovorum subsp. carotovorum]
MVILPGNTLIINGWLSNPFRVSQSPASVSSPLSLPLRRYLGDAANEEVYCELRYQGQLYDAETGGFTTIGIVTMMRRAGSTCRLTR